MQTITIGIMPLTELRAQLLTAMTAYYGVRRNYGWPRNGRHGFLQNRGPEMLQLLRSQWP
jgi:hypothetical protein